MLTQEMHQITIPGEISECLKEMRGWISTEELHRGAPHQKMMNLIKMPALHVEAALQHGRVSKIKQPTQVVEEE